MSIFSKNKNDGGFIINTDADTDTEKISGTKNLAPHAITLKRFLLFGLRATTNIRILTVINQVHSIHLKNACTFKVKKTR